MSSHAPLPHPDDYPDRDVVLFDGDCQFCRYQVQKLFRLSGDRLSFLSLHDTSVADRYPDLTHDALLQAMHVLDRRGRCHVGAAAVRYLSSRLPMLWAFAPVLYLPGSLPVWSWLYRQVAKRRYRFAGRCEDGKCAVRT